MKTIQNACELHPKALDINVGDQIEKLDQVISETEGREYFKKTFITEGMKILLTKGMARLAGKSTDAIFHLKQAMGGGKTHLMVGFGLLAKNAELSGKNGSEVHAISIRDFGSAKIAAFNGRNNPGTPISGEKLPASWPEKAFFREFWESGAKAPDEQSWLITCLKEMSPILILLDEMPPYFHYYSHSEY